MTFIIIREQTMPDLKQQVGLRVKVLRKERGLTQQKLAEKVNLSLNMVGCIERGEKFPSAETFQRLASALKVQPQDLFEFNGPYSAEEVEKKEALKRLRDLLETTPTEFIKSIKKIIIDAIKKHN
jgi:transcriptional regulator with XRE-family HTH domain